MFKNIIYVEDGSIDYDTLVEDLDETTKVILYRQGSTPPKVEQLSQARKETAEKFVKEVDDCMQGNDLAKIMAYRIKELAKQFGVEVNND